jgi:hypothetical protein
MRPQVGFQLQTILTAASACGADILRNDDTQFFSLVNLFELVDELSPEP